MLTWFRSLWSRKSLSLDDDERQNLTTYAMMGGAMAMTILVGALVWVIRWSWPQALLAELAPEILNSISYIAYGSLGLVAIMVIAQATIAVGGRFKGKLGMAEFEAETDQAPTTRRRHRVEETEEERQC